VAKRKEQKKVKTPLKSDGSPDLRYAKNKTKRKPTAYQVISKQFTKINDKLPEESKLSYRQRRKLIKEKILPQFKDIARSKIRVTPIKAAIVGVIEELPPKEGCDINLLDISDYAYVEWFALDETIRELVPDCIFIQVSAGEYGQTKIFNTRNYDYNVQGVKEIVDSIRPDADNEPSGTYIFSAYKKLRPKKKNDGTPENYYLDFVLTHIDKKGREEAYGDTEQVEYTPPKGKAYKKAKNKVKEMIEGKIKALKSKKDSRRRAKKTLEKNIAKGNAFFKRLKKEKKPTAALTRKANAEFKRELELLEKYYKEGKITEYNYKKSLDRIFKNFNQ